MSSITRAAAMDSWCVAAVLGFWMCLVAQLVVGDHVRPVLRFNGERIERDCYCRFQSSLRLPYTTGDDFLISARMTAGALYSEKSFRRFHWNQAVLYLVFDIVLITYFSAEGAGKHFAQGAESECFDVSASHHCSDLNTTSFVERLLAAEKPDLVVFTGMLSFIPQHCLVIADFSSL